MVDTATAITNPKENLGRDVRMSKDGELVLTSGNDFSLMIFEENLKMAILNRLKTAVGELELHPNYGSTIKNEFGSAFTDTLQDRLTLSVRTCLLQEPRISSINDITIELLTNDITPNKTLSISITITTISSIEPLNLVYELFV